MNETIIDETVIQSAIERAERQNEIRKLLLIQKIKFGYKSRNATPCRDDDIWCKRQPVCKFGFYGVWDEWEWFANEYILAHTTLSDCEEMFAEMLEAYRTPGGQTTTQAEFNAIYEMMKNDVE